MGPDSTFGAQIKNDNITMIENKRTMSNVEKDAKIYLF